jgi:hypothetical protein
MYRTSFLRNIDIEVSLGLLAILIWAVAFVIGGRTLCIGT